MADRAKMEELSRRFETKADKIRALSAVGHSRVEIAEFLKIRYQHVRNVLVRSENKKRGPDDGKSGPSDSADVRGGIRNRMRLKIDSGGRILIPSAVREAMNVGENGAILAWLEKGELRLVSPKVALRQAQELARELGVGRGLADELIADRREEAKREKANG